MVIIIIPFFFLCVFRKIAQAIDKQAPMAMHTKARPKGFEIDWYQLFAELSLLAAVVYIE
jgi:hypothetical protein